MISPSMQLAGGYLLVAFVASCICHQQQDNLGQHNLKLLCENDSRLTLSRASQVRSLVEEYERNPISCPSTIVEALKDLNSLIEANRNDVCRLEAISRIQTFYRTYVASSVTSEQQQKQQNDFVVLPTSLRNLFLGYGLQVSRACKVNMIPTLMSTKDYLKQVGEPVELEGPLKEKLDEYHELLAGILAAGGKVDSLVRVPADYDDLILPQDVEQLVQEQQQSGGNPADKLYVQAKSLHSLKVFKGICERRYKSIYKQLIMPILYLSNMGFSYRGEDLELELAEIQANEKVRLYYRVTFFCESLANLEFVEDLADADENKRMESTQVVRILTPDEARERQRRNEQVLASDPEGKYEETNKMIESMGQFVFVPDYSIQIADDILEGPDSTVMKLVNSFNVNRSELDQIRRRFLRKFIQTIKSILQNRLMISFSRFFLMPGFGDSNSKSASDLSNTDLMNLIDSHMDETYNTDKPVAGFSWGGVRRVYFQAARASRTDYRPKIEKGIQNFALGTRFWQFLGFFIFGVSIVVAITVVSVG